jgi:NifB/MoaA-like Fe-S oxidoreductase
MPDGNRVRTLGPARHELSAIDDLAMVAARHADRLLASARERGAARWVTFLEPLPDRLRDEELPALRAAAVRARAAYGPQDSVRDVLSGEVTEPFLESIDRLLREINRHSHDPDRARRG